MLRAPELVLSPSMKHLNAFRTLLLVCSTVALLGCPPADKTGGDPEPTPAVKSADEPAAPVDEEPTGPDPIPPATPGTESKTRAPAGGD